jgi:hypothetical protein
MLPLVSLLYHNTTEAVAPYEICGERAQKALDNCRGIGYNRPRQ